MAIDFLATAPMKITSLKEKTTESDVEEEREESKKHHTSTGGGGASQKAELSRSCNLNDTFYRAGD